MKNIEIQKFLEELGGDYSIVLKDLSKDRDSFLKNPEKLVKSASTIKISVMMEIMAKVAEGKLSLSQDIKIHKTERVPFSTISKMQADVFKLNDLLLFMMSSSDNTATNKLIDIAGIEDINARMRTLGVKKTVLCRKMMDFESAAKGLENYTCAEDLAMLLELMYKNKYFQGSEICSKMVDYMSTGLNREFMDRYLPEELVVAHKTGELNHIDHDCGIVYLKDYAADYMTGTDSFEKTNNGEIGDYLLVILGEGFEDNMVGREKISRISEFVYKLALKNWK